MHNQKLKKVDRAEKKEALNKQINEAAEEIKQRAVKYKSKGKDALIIGGIVVAGYAISKLLSSSNTKETVNPELLKEEKPSVLGAALKGAATSILLSVVQKKLMDYIGSEKETND